ncbi:hypothetical protein ABZ622_41320 [Streptomyces sp. NPDC007164]|uniref:hypothetical protein n=1 Tax=Streptomyces sp. NPDC007164 TaxID=3156918 RepID=UPI0033FC02CF
MRARSVLAALALAAEIAALYGQKQREGAGRLRSRTSKSPAGSAGLFRPVVFVIPAALLLGRITLPE